MCLGCAAALLALRANAIAPSIQVISVQQAIASAFMSVF
jgi:hypothetical protein